VMDDVLADNLGIVLQQCHDRPRLSLMYAAKT